MRRYRLMIALGLALTALTVAGIACGSSKSTKNDATSTPQKTAVSTPVATTSSETTQATPPSTASSQTTPSGSTTIAVGQHATLGKIATDASGKTLYKFADDELNKSNCSDACAQVWPPLTISGGTPTAASGVTGQLGTIERPDGTMQVTLDGAPLYTYANDTAPGDANGDGLLGKWSAVKAGG